MATAAEPLARLTAIVHEALFYEDAQQGPIFRWTEPRIAQDDDAYLGCAADQVAFHLIDHREEVAALLAAIPRSEPAGE